MITVLGIAGSMRAPSRTLSTLEVALAAAREAGARIELIEARTVELPIYRPGAEKLPVARELLDRIADAHACIVATPDYHGTLSGALKNLFDYLNDEFSGKLCGGIVTTSALVNNGALGQLQHILTALHAWTLPYGATAVAEDFDVGNQIINARLRDRLQRLGRDVTVYGEMIYERFTTDRIPRGGPWLGFAPWHARE